PNFNCVVVGCSGDLVPVGAEGDLLDGFGVPAEDPRLFRFAPPDPGRAVIGGGDDPRSVWAEGDRPDRTVVAPQNHGRSDRDQSGPTTAGIEAQVPDSGASVGGTGNSSKTIRAERNTGDHFGVALQLVEISFCFGIPNECDAIRKTADCPFAIRA